MRAWVAEQGWLETVQLPSYAPDLNPVECLWSTLKGRDLAGHACRNVDELLLAAQVGVIRIRREPELLWGFLRHTGLPLNDFTQLPKDQQLHRRLSAFQGHLRHIHRRVHGAFTRFVRNGQPSQRLASQHRA
jgi:hypothetical protein